MAYRIRIVPEIEVWLGELRGDDPGAAKLVDEAVDALREGGADLGAPLVVPVEIPARQRRPDAADAGQQQLERFVRARRAVADAVTARKRVGLEIQRLEELMSQLGEQRGQAVEIGDDKLAAYLRGRQSFVADQLSGLHRRYAHLRAEEERQTEASHQLQLEVDGARDLDPGPASSLILSELRPGAPRSADIRILFAVGPSDTAVLLAAGTERDWLRAWYAEMVVRCQARYEQDHGSTG